MPQDKDIKCLSHQRENRHQECRQQSFSDNLLRFFFWFLFTSKNEYRQNEFRNLMNLTLSHYFSAKIQKWTKSCLSIKKHSEGLGNIKQQNSKGWGQNQKQVFNMILICHFSL